MNPLAKITVSLVVTVPKSVDLAQVTGIIRTEPTRLWRQPKDMDNPLLDVSAWKLTLDEYAADDFDIAINAIIDKVWDSRKELLKFCEENKGLISVHLQPHAKSDTIVYAIDDPNTIHRLSALKARVHFHLET